ncbi:MAG: electron transfer flavoprotein subunit alpha/FixB family protein [Spirochaetaceae bacterium]|nr:electron transfer flavoprotein subunit alpha/FixB family protein [Spirochaetaceae bacterium]
MNIDEYKGVLVFAEQRGGQVQKIAYELLGAGRSIADSLGEPLLAMLAGSGLTDAQTADLVAAGADEVILLDDESLADYMTEPYAKALVAVIRERKPSVCLVGATTIGRDLAPRAAARLGTGLTADCTGLAVEEETCNLLMTRPAFGGNIMATIVCPEHRPQMSTVRPGVMRRLAKDPARQGKMSRFVLAFEPSDRTVEILETVTEKVEKKNIEDASILVSGGRGLGSEENFEKLQGLATELGGLVSASRAVVDSGWASQDRQVGQTGKTVRPDLYLACGISGMIQHIAGMEDSDYIIAVNKNADAPIFGYADLGIVTDVNKLVPALIDELKTAKAQS